MKTIFDSSFKYKPSFETNVRKTFERIRREQQSQSGGPGTADSAMTVKVLQLDQVKKGRQTAMR